MGFGVWDKKGSEVRFEGVRAPVSWATLAEIVAMAMV